MGSWGVDESMSRERSQEMFIGWDWSLYSIYSSSFSSHNTSYCERHFRKRGVYKKRTNHKVEGRE
jgi:hypothetical protein